MITTKPPRWQTEGKEPDYRFSLANERTFLAWIRTALALLGGGILLDQFSTKLQPHTTVLALAIGLCMIAALLSAAAYRRWVANETAMRNSAPLPRTRGLPLLSAWSLAVTGIILLLLVAK